MVGIVGFCDWSTQERVDVENRTRLESLVIDQLCFGPDGCARYCDSNVALAQYLDYQTEEARLVVSPEQDRDSGLVLVADLRLDNRDELANLLGLGHSELARISDEALVLRGIAQQGNQFFASLRGDFFVAVWNSRSLRLTLARDGLGVKPGNYALTKKGIVFGSMVPWVLRDAKVSRKPCLNRIADFIAVSFDDLERTFYEDVRRIEPGTYIEFSVTGQYQHRYWSLELGPELRLRDNREYAEQFRWLLRDAVKNRLRGPVKTALLLSGGLDSSSIAGAARELGLASDASPLATISALFPDYPGIDETSWIAEVLVGGGLQPAFVRVDRTTPLSRLAQEIARYEEPFYSPNNFVDSTLLDAAQAAGARRVIDGLDGDTTVGHGWEFLGELFRRGRLRRLLRLARQLASHTDRSAIWYIMRHALVPTISGLANIVMPWRGVAVPRLMSDKLAKAVSYQRSVQHRRSPYAYAQLSPFRRQHFAKLTSGLLSSSFELAWRQAAVRGMSRVHPYFDRRLVEYCVSLPAEQRLARGVDRMVQRRAVEGLVPESIRTRLTKSIWAQNTTDRMRLDERDAVEELLSFPDPVLEDYINIDVLRASCRELLRSSVPSRALAEIWVALALKVWLNGTVR